MSRRFRVGWLDAYKASEQAGVILERPPGVDHVREGDVFLSRAGRRLPAMACALVGDVANVIRVETL